MGPFNLYPFYRDMGHMEIARYQPPGHLTLEKAGLWNLWNICMHQKLWQEWENVWFSLWLTLLQDDVTPGPSIYCRLPVPLVDSQLAHQRWLLQRIKAGQRKNRTWTFSSFLSIPWLLSTLTLFLQLDTGKKSWLASWLDQ